MKRDAPDEEDEPLPDAKRAANDNAAAEAPAEDGQPAAVLADTDANAAAAVGAAEASATSAEPKTEEAEPAPPAGDAAPAAPADDAAPAAPVLLTSSTGDAAAAAASEGGQPEAAEAAAAAAAAAAYAGYAQQAALGKDQLAQILAANPSLVDGPAGMAATPFEEMDVSLKLELHGDAAAAIFGYDGLTITTIRERTSCRMRLLDSAAVDPDRRLFEMGGTEQACKEAVGLILAELNQSCSTNTNVCTPAAEGPQYATRVLVRTDSCGTIIGKGGATISAMRMASGAQIKIDAAEIPGLSTSGPSAPADRMITISGLVTAVHAALIDLIPRLAQYIRQAKAKAQLGPAGGAAGGAGGEGGRAAAQAGGVHPLEQGPGYVHPVSSHIVGRVIGPGGTQIRLIRDTTGARVRVGNDVIPGTNDRPVTIWGTDPQVQQVLAMINEIASRPDDRPPRMPKGGGGAPPPSYPGYPPPSYHGYPPQSYGAPPPMNYAAYPGYGAPPAPPQQHHQQPPPPPASSGGYDAYAQYYQQPPPPPPQGHQPPPPPPPGGAPGGDPNNPYGAYPPPHPSYQYQ
jgi:predicted RNA-binding protein YlqC (UPF0109 family)